MGCRNNKSKTHAAEDLKEIFRDYMYDRDDELFEKRIADCFDEYDGYIFEGDHVNNTIANSLGKKRVDYLIKFSKR